MLHAITDKHGANIAAGSVSNLFNKNRILYVKYYKNGHFYYLFSKGLVKKKSVLLAAD